jgi:hypothetical protein
MEDSPDLLGGSLASSMLLYSYCPLVCLPGVQCCIGICSHVSCNVYKPRCQSSALLTDDTHRRLRDIVACLWHLLTAVMSA